MKNYRRRLFFADPSDRATKKGVNEMSKDRYIYPAIFEYAKDGIAIEFPDLPGCLPCAQTTEEALANAKEALSLHLYGMERDKDDIPEPTPVNKLKAEKNQVVVLVETWMPIIRDAIENKAIKNPYYSQGS